jgi:hypothetical protein
MFEELKDYQLMNYSTEIPVAIKADTPTIYCFSLWNRK